MNSNDAKTVLRVVKIVAAVLVILILGFNCYYTIGEQEQAVVTTFGKVTDITDAGVHFKLPFGIQKVQNVDIHVYQKIELGYTSDKNDYTTKTSESTMITGDYNIVNVDFFVEYKITDPVAYLYASIDPELILKNLIQSQVRNVVGSSTVDAVLTDGKENIQMQVRELVTEILADYDIGLSLVDVRIQDSEPPTKAVVEAFKAVEEKVKPAFTENGAKILQWMQDNQEQFNNIFKSKEIGEGLFISSRAASGSIRKLVTDGYVSKIGGNPSCYSLTSAGMECVVSTEGAEED
jgi:HflK protein